MSLKLWLSSLPEATWASSAHRDLQRPYRQDRVNCPPEDERTWKLDLKVKFRACSGNGRLGAGVQGSGQSGGGGGETSQVGWDRWQARSLGLTLQAVENLKDSWVEKIVVQGTYHYLKWLDSWLVYCLSSHGSSLLPRVKLHGRGTLYVLLCLKECLAYSRCLIKEQIHDIDRKWVMWKIDGWGYFKAGRPVRKL